MGKYDHVSELTGAENYPQWRRQITLALQGEGLWQHCSNGTDISDFEEYASIKPTFANPSQPTTDEIKEMKEWIRDDAKAKEIICRKISSLVLSILDEKKSAREHAERLKDASDATHYLGAFQDARRRFVEMGATFTDDEAVFMLLEGLPKTVEWKVFKRLTMQTLSLAATTNVSPKPSTSTAPVIYPRTAPKPSSFNKVTQLLIEEANSIVGSTKLAGPGSEYANAAMTQPSAKNGGKSVITNPATGIRIHKFNTKGERCTNRVGGCVDLP
ncbi:hypothetical protein PAXRUDRAFT_15379 [Paxillus rubicundulus Ve08.2h10]|uniref:Retrotransposon Copia-like N-terminal domain-containing protein n=1 Tax=Paxillus rubicundulus Ve08.2h10 TaxID=930991 RepID=A0A0D0DI35_9AGAM|nr:hypothetical protein PAXRUDRAFT_15379 [Paxillus rubicundulus Ve08.2h10]